MNDSISILVAVILIFIAFRWMMGGSQPQPRQQQSRSVRRQHRATPQMVERVRAVFPDIPVQAIVADLQRTGSVETTVDNALRNGGLPLPQPSTPPQTHTTQSTQSTASRTSATPKTNHTNLLQRYNIISTEVEDVEPPKVWDTSAAKRQEMLRKRKEYMVLQARKKLLESQSPSPSSSPSSSPAPAPVDTPTQPAASTSFTKNEQEASSDAFSQLSVKELNALSPEEKRRHLLEAMERKNKV